MDKMSLNSPAASLDSEPPLPPPTLDSVLGKLGNPGKYQVVLMLLLATNYIPVVVNHLLMAFYSARVPFTCQVGSCSCTRHHGLVTHVASTAILPNTMFIIICCDVKSFMETHVDK